MNFKDGAGIPTEQPLLSAPLSTETSQNRSVLPADWRPMGSVSTGKPNWALGWAQTPPMSVHSVYSLVHLSMVKFMPMTLPHGVCAWSRSSTELPSFGYMGEDSHSLEEENTAVWEQVVGKSLLLPVFFLKTDIST